MAGKNAEIFELNPEPFVPHSCGYCQKIVVAHEPRRQRLSRRQIFQAGKNGCIVLAHISQRQHEAHDWIDSFEFKDAIKEILESEAATHGCRRAVVTLAQLVLQTFYACIHDEWRSSHLVFKVGGLDMSVHFEINADPESHAASKFTLKPINRAVSSKVALAKARRWLENCAYHAADIHPQCPIFTTDDPTHILPSRLVRVDIKQGRLALVSSNTISRGSLRYSCLSYCWGGSQPFTTTKETLRQRMGGFEISDLPSTLRDAVIVTTELDVQFIWIDCLCIIQDDTVDMTREIANMPEIYTGAYVTISASSASTCHDGFLGTRYLDQRADNADVDDFVLPYQHNGLTSTIYLHQTNKSLPLLRSQNDPINKRAWTFQERELSPRVLIFGSHQLEWICNSHMLRDRGFAYSENERLLVKYAALDPHDSNNRIIWNNSKYPFIWNISKDRFLSDWMKTIEAYSGRILRYPEDKLIAISAIASRLGALVKISYIAGLWDHDLLSQLLWFARNPTARRKKYRAPSWSWASVDGPVYFRPQSVHELHIVSTTVVPTDPGFVYGAVRHVSLTVEGRWIQALWLPNRDDIAWNGLSHKNDIPSTTIRRDAIEPDWDTEDPDFGVQVCWLILHWDFFPPEIYSNASGLLLVADTSSHDTYRRVGLLDVKADGDGLYNTIEKRVVTLI